MATTAGVPSDLTPLKEPLIEAVINAYMAKKINETTPWTYTHGSCDAGEFRYKHDRFGLDQNVYCSYPDGQWKEDWSFEGDPSRDPGYGAGGDPELVLFDAKAIYDQVRTEVSSWVDPWIACSDPNELTSAVQELAGVANQLYVTNEVGVGGSPSEPNNPGAINTPVPDVRAAVVDMQSDLEPLKGLAIDALKRSYTSDVGLTISGQRAMAAVAALAVGGEAEAWSRAYGGLVDFFRQATNDFNSFAQSNDGSGGTAQALTVVSGVATVATAATAEFPPVAIAFAAVAGLSAIGASFFPDEPARPAVILSLEGGDFDSLWGSFQQKTRDVDLEITHAESMLGAMCQKVLASYDANPDSFSITSRGPHNIAQAGDNLPRFLNTDQNSAPIELYAGDGIEIVHTRLESVAAEIEHVGDHQRAQAGVMGSGQGTTASGWYRTTLHGTILGWGENGHQSDVNDLVDGLVDLLLLESGTAHRIAEHCYDISTDFKKTDAQIEAELDQIESKLDPVVPR